MRKRNIQHTTPANRGVFCDLRFDEAEAHVLAMRADLMAALREHIKDRGWIGVACFKSSLPWFPQRRSGNRPTSPIDRQHSPAAIGAGIYVVSVDQNIGVKTMLSPKIQGRC